ncbi:MAG: hypothetical protein ABIL01_35030 [Pseudomonadota bacterium]
MTLDDRISLASKLIAQRERADFEAERRKIRMLRLSWVIGAPHEV